MYWFFLTLILLHLTFQRDFLPRSRAIIIMHHKAIALMAIFLVMATLANGAPMKIIFTLILFSSPANSIPAEDTLHLPSEKESHSYTTSLALFLPFYPSRDGLLSAKLIKNFHWEKLRCNGHPLRITSYSKVTPKKIEDDKLKHTCFRSLHLSRWGRRR